MKIADVPFALLRFQYQFVRFPLQLIEDRVVTRMNPEAPGRLLYERSFGSLDAMVGSVLGDPELAERGSALAERGDLLARAARLDGAATQKEQHADETLMAKRNQALEEIDAVHEAKQREVDEAAAAADDRKRAAVDGVRVQAADAKRTADDVAARRARSVENAKREEHSRIRAAEQAQAAAADAKLTHAEEERSKAANTWIQADRVEQLAEQEKEKRQAERAAKG
jgi:hypothetical protein